MIFPFGVTASLLSFSSTTRDADGNDIATWTTTSVTGCAFSPGGSLERTQGGDLVETTPTLFMPAGSTVKATDRITVLGSTYEVDGTPSTESSPFTGTTFGVVVKLRQVTG